jgi:Flp pilus assembly protein TadD
MHIRTTTAAITAVLAITLVGCSSSDDSKPVDKPKASTKQKVKPSSLTAKKAAQQLADATGVTDLGNPTDNTSGCASKDGNGCEQLITTDTVSVYEFKTTAVSAHWVKTMKVNGDWRQVGRFALAWTARDQKLTSDERRDELTKAMQKLTAKE